MTKAATKPTTLKPVKPDIWLTVPRATKVLMQARSLAWRWAAAGEIETQRLTGGPSKIKLADLLRAIEEVAERGDQ